MRKIYSMANVVHNGLELTNISLFGHTNTDVEVKVFAQQRKKNTTDVLELFPTHNCCATWSLSGFYDHPSEINTWLEHKLNSYSDYSAVLTDTQDKKYGHILEKYGFTKIRRWHNRAHGPSILNLYIRGFEDEKPLPLYES